MLALYSRSMSSTSGQARDAAGMDYPYLQDRRNCHSLGTCSIYLQSMNGRPMRGGVRSTVRLNPCFWSTQCLADPLPIRFWYSTHWCCWEICYHCEFPSGCNGSLWKAILALLYQVRALQVRMGLVKISDAKVVQSRNDHGERAVCHIFCSDIGQECIWCEYRMGWDWLFGFMQYNEAWKERRRLFQTKFHPLDTGSYQPKELEHTHKLLKRLLESPEHFAEHIRQ